MISFSVTCNSFSVSSTLSKVKEKELITWINEHKCFKSKEDLRLSYIFRPAELDIKILVRCDCGSEINL